MSRIDPTGGFNPTTFAPNCVPANRLLREGAGMAPESGPSEMIRSHLSLAGASSWRVELFGFAGRLEEFAA